MHIRTITFTGYSDVGTLEAVEQATSEANQFWSLRGTKPAALLHAPQMTTITNNGGDYYATILYTLALDAGAVEAFDSYNSHLVQTIER
ncbi:MAG: hypothetical protein HC828_01980 [Blastochloris sp.]|nr:hypothetical protein [Blastochloris sp.]